MAAAAEKDIQEFLKMASGALIEWTSVEGLNFSLQTRVGHFV
jgi:hypothetical protein